MRIWISATCLSKSQAMRLCPIRLDAGTVDQKVQRAAAATIRQAHAQGLLAGAKRAEIEQPPAGPTSRSKLSTNPVVCLSDIPNRILMVGQLWIAASLNSEITLQCMACTEPFLNDLIGVCIGLQ